MDTNIRTRQKTYTTSPMARAIFAVICNKDLQYLTRKDIVKRKYDNFTGIRMASDEIHVVKIWKFNHQTVENKLYPHLKGRAKKV
jgi:hypothetical protein